MKLIVFKFFALILFFQIRSWGQTFTPGYILKSAEKTSGLLSFNPGSAEKIRFKSSKGETASDIKAEGIDEFYLEDYHFRFISVVDTVTKHRVFAQVLVDGPVLLASSGESYFLLKQGESLQVNFVSEKEKVTLSRARGLVKFLLSDCGGGEIEKKLRMLTPAILKSAVATYNMCKSSVSGTARRRLEFGILAGVNMPSLVFDRSEFNYFDGQPGFKAGLTLDVVPKRFATRTMLNFQATILENGFKEKSNSLISALKINLNHLTVRTGVSVKFFFLPGQRGVFLNPGVLPYFVLNDNTNTTFVRYLGGGVMGSIGIGYEEKMFSRSKIAFTFRYEGSLTQVTTGNALVPATSTLKQLQFDVGVKF